MTLLTAFCPSRSSWFPLGWAELVGKERCGVLPLPFCSAGVSAGCPCGLGGEAGVPVPLGVCDSFSNVPCFAPSASAAFTSNHLFHTTLHLQIELPVQQHPILFNFSSNPSYLQNRTLSRILPFRRRNN